MRTDRSTRTARRVGHNVTRVEGSEGSSGGGGVAPAPPSVTIFLEADFSDPNHEAWIIQ